MMRRLNRLLKLSGSEFRVLLFACLLLNGIRLALFLFPFNSIRQRLTQFSTVWICQDENSPISVRFIGWAIHIAGRYTLGTAKCLVRALTAQLLLTRYGYPHQLHIGVAKSAADTLEAHAWIEYQGRVIVGQLNDLSRFKSLASEGIK
ncbi:lasso peptide biosynthesis B2 protein [Leptolyngbya sp. Heron Island J]|uniref:lasso peptide biosynthesis B2 protein n=1 Tax=Leptolyngbya sp. Heron Island J TaxID=1385935 RepID=UPI0009DF99EF|nr:lasso peptide biosynthesis B2 protein [Leptolyngbya sp. Heron Island J]